MEELRCSCLTNIVVDGLVVGAQERLSAFDLLAVVHDRLQAEYSSVRKRYYFRTFL